MQQSTSAVEVHLDLLYSLDKKNNFINLTIFIEQDALVIE
jgi:hypothetical protein